MCSQQLPAKALSDRPARSYWSNAAFYVLLFALYLTLNSVLNLANRWALGLSGFSFPLLLTMAHAMFSFSVLGPILSAMKVDHISTLRRSWKGILVIGVLMGCNIACNNLSLVHLPLSLNQVTRASLPVVTAAVAVIVERKVPTREELGALILLTLGVTVTVFEGKATGSGAGLLLCIAGVLCAAAMLSTAGRILSEKMDVLQLTFYTAPVSCALLFPMYLAREHANFMTYVGDNQKGVVLIVAFSSIVALAYNITHNYLLQRTSAVTVTVLGEVKIVGLLLLSAMILPGESSQFTLKMTAGCVLAIAAPPPCTEPENCTGFCLYSNAKIVAQKTSSTVAQASDSQSTQEKIVELITNGSRSHMLGGSTKNPHRSCPQLSFFQMFHRAIARRPTAAGSKAGKQHQSGQMFVVADSSTKDFEAAPLLRGGEGSREAAESQEASSQLDRVTVHSGYESLGGTLTHVNGRAGCQQPSGGPPASTFGQEPGKVSAVVDQSILNLPDSMRAKPALAPRSYEALQLFDSAPRGFSLVQPS